jgi:hypothetical protein
MGDSTVITGKEKMLEVESLVFHRETRCPEKTIKHWHREERRG